MEQYLNLKGAKLFYEDRGDKFPIVFIHGLGIDHRMWQAQIAYFSKHFRVIAYDVRGFGKSTFEKSPEAHVAADDLKALLEHLGLVKAHIVGLSMGGNIALSFAQKYPNKVEKLVVVSSDIQGFDNYTDELKAVFGDVFQTGAKEGALKAKLKWAKNPLLQPYNNTPEIESLMATMLKEYSGVHFTNPHLLPGANPPTIERLSEIKADTLIVVGDKDQEDFHRMADLMLEEIPKSRKLVIPQAGHLPNLEQSEDFNRDLLDYLA